MLFAENVCVSQTFWSAAVSQAGSAPCARSDLLQNFELLVPPAPPQWTQLSQWSSRHTARPGDHGNISYCQISRQVLCFLLFALEKKFSRR